MQLHHPLVHPITRRTSVIRSSYPGRTPFTTCYTYRIAYITESLTFAAQKQTVCQFTGTNSYMGRMPKALAIFHHRQPFQLGSHHYEPRETIDRSRSRLCPRTHLLESART